MEIKDFGLTGLKVSRMGLGLAALGRPGYINLGHGKDLSFDYNPGSMKSHTLKVLDCAYGLGIRYFDVARSYGKGEEFLSYWIKANTEKKDFIVGSKWGYTYTADWKVDAVKHEVKEHTSNVLERQYPESAKLLGDYLSIYHIHSATLDSGVLDNKKVLEKLWQLKESGIIVGLSLSGIGQGETLDKALNIRNGGDRLFQSVQVTWNLLEQSATNILTKASSNGCGIIVKEALANGRLTDRNGDLSFAGKREILDKLAVKYDCGIDALSLAFVLNQKWANVVLSGASTEEQLKSNVESLQIVLDERDIAVLESLKEEPSAYWSSRSELSWN
ncbi:MAG: aldo/keto reductase [Sporocytophaga sp.]|uniref:aldo/keto reductase n=1 Tax=Sporocytophaga sp. TaxID=2231183 RepID=UPI001B172F77|nr:aldo/keto reductase [Sporocytophaga sp.]MBO9698965.1 aldo/keto reductase [Sporocytophaga sp.]